MKKCGLYARVSTDIQAQAKDGSLDTQISIMEKQIEVKKMSSPGEEWEIVEVYREEGRSGKDTNRPEFQKMLNDIENGKIDVLVCTKIDRVTRSLPDFYDLWENLERHDVDFWSINENWDTSRAESRAFMKILLVFAELERERTSERTKEKMQWRSEQGYSNGGQRLGYDINPKDKSTPKANPEEKELVNLMIEEKQRDKE